MTSQCRNKELDEVIIQFRVFIEHSKWHRQMRQFSFAFDIKPLFYVLTANYRTDLSLQLTNKTL